MGVPILETQNSHTKHSIPSICYALEFLKMPAPGARCLVPLAALQPECWPRPCQDFQTAGKIWSAGVTVAGGGTGGETRSGRIVGRCPRSAPQPLPAALS